MEPEINLLDFWRILKKRKILFVATVFVVTAAAVVFSLVYPVSYQAKASLMPVTSQKMSGLAGLMGGQGGLNILSGLGGGTTVSSQIQAVLSSRTLAERVINKCGLLRRIYDKAWDADRGGWRTGPDGKSMEPPMDDAVDTLLKMMNFDEDRKTFLITITATMKDPTSVSQVVNCYLDELGAHIQQNTFTTAKRNRIFIEAQLERNKILLLEAGKGISAFYSANKVSNVSPMLDVDVSQAADDAKLEDLQKQADELDKKIAQAELVRDVPEQVYLQYLTLRRQLLGQVNMLLTQQYEMAKIDEAREEPTFQIVDRPRVPLHRFRPKRKQMVMVGFALAVFSGVMAVLFRDYLDRLKAREARA
jgi:uncharacterized protein involved in exopolysaccharide biosynthesis